MNYESDDPNPEQTLPPGQSGVKRRVLGSEPTQELNPGTSTRRLKLGTPTRSQTTQRAEVQRTEMGASPHRGFTLGPEQRVVETQAKTGSKTAVQPWILMVAGGALVLLVIALLIRPSSASSAEAVAQERLVAQYTKYLETKGSKTNLDITVRKKEVVDRLQAVAWAKAIGDQAALETELSGLLFLDDDKNSPLYQYSVSQLKQLGPRRKRAGT